MASPRRTAEFSESTYAFGVTFEIVRLLESRTSLVAAPIIPTLQEEADLGYDVKVEASWGLIFLQYKLSERMHRSNAAEYPHWGRPYLRFTAKTDATSSGSVQHNVLCDLELSMAAGGGVVYYAAPLFLLQSELSRHLLNHQITDHSVFPTPGQLGRQPVSSVHRYTYTNAGDVLPCSEPGEPRAAGFDLAYEQVLNLVRGREPELLTSFLARAAGLLREVTNDTSDQRDLSPVRQIALMSYGLGLQPVLVRYAPLESGGE